LQSDNRTLSAQTENGDVELRVEKEIARRKRLLKVYLILLSIPVAICIIFLRYGRSDRAVVTREVRQEFAPVQGRLASAEEAAIDLQSQLSATKSRINVTENQVKQVSALTAAVQQDNRAMSQVIKDQISQKADTKVVNTLGNQVQTVGDNVNALASNVADVRNQLTHTQQVFQTAQSEIARLMERNHNEVESLRRLGERNYFEFAVPIDKTPQKVGLAMIAVFELNKKRNQFSAMVGIEDTQLYLEKRSLGEIIYLRLAGSRQPLEFVVTQLSKDKIIGYLSVPKNPDQ